MSVQTMTIDECIEALQEAREKVGGDALIVDPGHIPIKPLRSARFSPVQGSPAVGYVYFGAYDKEDLWGS